MALEISFPDDLFEQYATGDLVLFFGEDLAALFGIPTRFQLTEMLIDWAVTNDLGDNTWAPLDPQRMDQILEKIARRARDEGKEVAYHAFLQKALMKPRRITPIQRSLGMLKAVAAISTDLSNLTQAAFMERTEEANTPWDDRKLLRAFATRQFFQLKIRGRLGLPNTLSLSNSAFDSMVASRPDFCLLMRRILTFRTVLFIGARKREIDDFLRRFAPDERLRTHYALALGIDSESEEKGVWTYRMNGTDFLEGLGSLIKAFHRSTTRFPPRSTKSCLRRLVLQDIGPFRSLTLDLDAHVNVLLGDNGVGKTHVLKSIAQVICGATGKPYAGDMIRVGSEDGKIHLVTDERTYKLALKKLADGVLLRLTPDRPIDVEGWPALAFPALRSARTEGLGGARGTNEDPLVSGVAPLLAGDLDFRIEDIKEWMLHIDHIIKDGGNGQAARFSNMRDKISEILDDFSERVCLRIHGVDPVARRVLVETDDGIVPIESTSQGMASLIGVICVLLRTLYEAYPEHPEPAKGFGIVLIDEIDAHMHPVWQQALLSKLRHHFPGIQLIVTSHSPFVVAGLDPSQVHRLMRHRDGSIRRVDVDEEMTQGYVGRLLTSALFGLRSTLDPQTRKKQERYHHSLVNKNRDPSEEKDFLRLEKEILLRTDPGEDSVEKRARDILNQLILEQLGRSEKNEVLLAKVEGLFEELRRRS